MVLVTMPFGPLVQPSIGLSLLAAGLRQAGPEPPSVRIEYLTIAFADLVGEDFYRWVNLESPNQWLLGEWIFAGALHDEPAGHEEHFEAEILSGPGAEKIATPERRRQLAAARQKATGFVEGTARRILAQRPKIVGFSNIFAQQVASLAVARRLKAADPDVTIVFGGANCEGEMGREIVSCFDFVDFAVSGEGDVVFPALVERILAGRPIESMQGVVTAERVASAESSDAPGNAPTVRDMDSLPIPDYADFFAQWNASECAQTLTPLVLFETSRGCWWGAHSHCTFCGLNGSSMTFRSKSADRVLGELRSFADRYPGRFLMSVDNILDFRYFNDLVPALADPEFSGSDPPLDLFFALKANLKKEQLRALHDAGIRRIQPGIESLSTEILRLMRKGETALQNIEVLKWCRELGLQVAWNLLWGFPGESPDAYGRMADLVPWLTHLTPPQSVGRIRLDRYSPGFDQGAELGFHDIRPCAAYDFVYPHHRASTPRLAYHFDFDFADDRDVESYTAELTRQVDAWRRDHEESGLFFDDRGDDLHVWDWRPAAHDMLSVLSGDDRRLYLACDRTRTLPSLAKELGIASSTDLERRVRRLQDQGLLLVRDGKALSLATAKVRARPAEAVNAREVAA